MDDEDDASRAERETSAAAGSSLTPAGSAPLPATGGGRTLLRSSAIVAVGTGLSRATGLVRTIVIAYSLGGALLGGTYNLANTTPNIVYELLLGGVLTATLIPVLVERFDRDDHEAINAVATVISVMFTVLTVVAVALSPAIMAFFTRFSSDPVEADRQATVALPLLFMFMPQVLFYGLGGLWTALLNARQRFAAAAFAPVLNNLIVIGVLLAMPHVAGGPVTFEAVRDNRGLLLLLGLGTTSGIITMTLVLWPAMRHAGIWLRFDFDWRHPAVRVVARLSGWTLGYVIVDQVALLVVLAVLNGLPGPRNVAAYTNAWQFVQLPMGLFTVSILTTFTPELARLAARQDFTAYRVRFHQGLRLILFVVIPAAVLLCTLAAPVISVLLERGSFTAADAEASSTALTWLAVMLPGLAVFVLAVRGFYTLQDTRTAFWLTVVQSSVEVVAAFALRDRFGLSGVMAGFAISYWLGAIVALTWLRRRIGGLGRIVGDVGRQVVAGVIMTGVVVLIVHALGPGAAAIVTLVAGGVAGAVVYLGVLVALRSHDIADLRSIRHGFAGR